MLQALKEALTQQWMAVARWITIGVTLWLAFEVFRDYLKGGAEVRVLSLRWRTLTRKGFRIAPDPKAGRRRRRVFDRLARHPAVLVILGFLLSGILGTWVTHLLDQQQREREANVKSMDDLRASMDDLSAAFSDYFYRSIALVNLRESGATQSQLSAARTEYEAAHYKWQQRLTVDGPNIQERYPAPENDVSAAVILGSLKAASGFVDDCIEQGTLRQRKAPVRGSDFQVVCTDTSVAGGVTADDRLIATGVCVNLFTMLMRPNPSNDSAGRRFNDDIVWRTTTKQLRDYCDVRRLLGVVDASGHERH
ncbi:hypothetical protein [Burkholderia anthina]|uniref:hypothetical protein n=1 Tax=Burkholderia anthina TaxID=179879 RepID=UPI00158D7A67|nr:hypothetical protein [Burkholderia anthina]